MLSALVLFSHAAPALDLLWMPGQSSSPGSFGTNHVKHHHGGPGWARPMLPSTVVPRHGRPDCLFFLQPSAPAGRVWEGPVWPASLARLSGVIILGWQSWAALLGNGKLWLCLVVVTW